MAPSWRIMPSWSKLSQLSTTLPSEKRKMPIPVISSSLPVGAMPPELPAVGPAHPPAGDHLVALGDLVLYLGVEVGEGFLELAREPLDVLGAALQHGAVGLVGEIVVEDLIHQIQLPLVAHLLDVAPENGLVLLRRHPPPPSRSADLLAPTRYARYLLWRNEPFDPPGRRACAESGWRAPTP